MVRVSQGITTKGREVQKGLQMKAESYIFVSWYIMGYKDVLRWMPHLTL